MCITMDEVSCNLTQERDGSNGGEKYLCGTQEDPYQSLSTKNRHFTCLGLTTLSGEGVMYVVIVQGKKRDILTETGIDWNMLCNGDDELFDMDKSDIFRFFQSNYGKHKLYPGGPSCTFYGIEIPAFITFTEHGGIDGRILTEIFEQLDALAFYNDDRSNGRISFVLLDDHQSKFDLQFVRF